MPRTIFIENPNDASKWNVTAANPDNVCRIFVG